MCIVYSTSFGTTEKMLHLYIAYFYYYLIYIYIYFYTKRLALVRSKSETAGTEAKKIPEEILTMSKQKHYQLSTMIKRKWSQFFPLPCLAVKSQSSAMLIRPTVQ